MEVRPKSHHYIFTIMCSLLFVHACSVLDGFDYMGNKKSNAEQTAQSMKDKHSTGNHAGERQSQERSYTVRRGDTLSSIAQKTTGDPNNWPQITAYNEITDPSKIQIGQKILIPSSLNPVTTPKSQPSAPPPTTSLDNKEGWLITRGSNYPREIYTKPDSSSDILIQVWPGTRLKYVDLIGGWYKVVTGAGFGYIHPTYVQKE